MLAALLSTLAASLVLPLAGLWRRPLALGSFVLACWFRWLLVVTARSLLLCLLLALCVRSALLRIRRSALRPLHLIVLLHYRVMRPVLVLLSLKYGLLLRGRISISGVRLLICGQRRTRGC